VLPRCCRWAVAEPPSQLQPAAFDAVILGGGGLGRVVFSAGFF
jgi:hypothetical protein